MQDSFDGVHQPGDTYKLALYSKSAVNGPMTTNYSVDGEARGPGYDPGGIILKGRRTGIVGRSVYMDFDDPSWPTCTIKAGGAMIYNASKNGRSLAVLKFKCDDDDEIASRDGPFSVELPPPGPKAAIRVDFPS